MTSVELFFLRKCVGMSSVDVCRAFGGIAMVRDYCCKFFCKFSDVASTVTGPYLLESVLVERE